MPPRDLVLQVDRTKQIVVVSCESIPERHGRDGHVLSRARPEIPRGSQAWDENRFHHRDGRRNPRTPKASTFGPFQSLENDPSEANRLSILENMLSDTGRTKDALTDRPGRAGF
jgi:hypothetical protein